MTTVSDAMLALLVVGFVIGFLLAFSMGANDVSNAFGPSYGSRVLSFVQVCILATIFEILGSVLLGGRVSDTIAKGIADLDLFSKTVYQLMYGYVSSLVGASGWLLIATIFKLPVSGTHSIVGAVIGFTLVAHGANGVKWMTLVKVVSSWFTSPLLSGAISSLLFIAVKYLVLRKANPLDAGCRLLPVLYGLTFTVISFMITDASISSFISNNGGDRLPIWVAVLIALGSGIMCWLLSSILVLPFIKARILKRMEELRRRQYNLTVDTGSVLSLPQPRPNTPRTKRVKVWVQKNSALIWQHLSVLSLHRNQSQSRSNSMSLTNTLSNFDESASSHHPHPVYLEAYTNADVVSMADNDNESESSLDDYNLAQQQQQSSSNNIVITTNYNNHQQNHHRNNDFLIDGGGGDSSAASIISQVVSPDSLQNNNNHNGEETPEICHLFSFIQVITATFASFSHGANDVSNAVGPVIGMYQIYKANEIPTESKPEWWILLFGGIAMSIGLWSLGKKVMKTIGDNLASSISPTTGFCMELGTSLTVLTASHLGVPISTTHCLVGSVICVSLVRSRRNGVDWRTARNIAFSWLVTVPASGLISAGCMAGLGAIFNAKGTFQYWDYFHPTPPRITIK